MPSDHVTTYGGEPLSAAWMLAGVPWQTVPPPLTTDVGPEQMSRVVEHETMNDPSVAVKVTMKKPRLGGVQPNVPCAGFPSVFTNVAPAGRPRLLSCTMSAGFGSVATTDSVNGAPTA